MIIPLPPTIRTASNKTHPSTSKRKPPKPQLSPMTISNLPSGLTNSPQSILKTSSKSCKNIPTSTSLLTPNITMRPTSRNNLMPLLKLPKSLTLNYLIASSSKSINPKCLTKSWQSTLGNRSSIPFTPTGATGHQKMSSNLRTNPVSVSLPFPLELSPQN